MREILQTGKPKKTHVEDKKSGENKNKKKNKIIEKNITLTNQDKKENM